MIALAIIFFAIGLLCIIRPNLVYRLSMIFKSDNSGDPSTLYIIGTRIGGVIWIAVGVLCIVYLFII